MFLRDVRSRRIAQLGALAVIGGLVIGVDRLSAQQREYAPSTSVDIDVAPKPLARLSPGIVVGEEARFGYSDLVTLIEPRLVSGHIDSLPKFARRYAGMFKLTVLANVISQQANGQTRYLLDKLGIGFAMEIGDRTIVVTKDTANDLGAQLGVIDRSVLGGNENCLNDVTQIARTPQLIVFDAEANMLVQGEHQERILRHLIWVSPKTGKLGYLVWLLRDGDTFGETEDYALDSLTMKLLPAGYREDRRINVADGGILSSIPTPDRFALIALPEGTDVPFNASLRRVAVKKEMTALTLRQLVDGATESLATLKAGR